MKKAGSGSNFWRGDQGLVEPAHDLAPPMRRAPLTRLVELDVRALDHLTPAVRFGCQEVVEVAPCQQLDLAARRRDSRNSRVAAIAPIVRLSTSATSGGTALGATIPK
jgi:hypothetical protein